MVTAPFLRSWIVACIAAALVACQDQPLPMTAPLAPVAEIVDAVHPVGNPHFFFLPPLVPMPTFGGTSDETQKPVVKVCQWLDATCVARIAEFPMESGTAAQVIRYDAKNQLYIVNWPTGQCVSGPCTLDPTKTYRLRVLIGVAELGHADIKVVKTSSGLKTINTTQYIGVLQGSTLAVKFRIEQGAVVTGAPGAPAPVGCGGGTVTSADGEVGLIIPPTALSQSTSITVAPSTGTVDPGILAGSVYDLEPSGTTFAAPVTLTIHYDPTKIPAGDDEGSLKLYENSGTGWERVAGSGPSLTDHTVSGAITHFSDAAPGVPVGQVHVFLKTGRPFVGYDVQLEAVTVGSNADTLSGRAATWASSDPGVATVDQTGLVSCVSLGQTTITATSDGVTGSLALDVAPLPVPVASVTVSPASASVQVGQFVRFTATTRDANGNPLPLDRSVNYWASSDNGVAMVTAVQANNPSNFLVTGVGVGLATITAASGPDLPVNGFVSGSSAITVTPLSLKVTPAFGFPCLGQALQLSATPMDASGNPLSDQTVTWASSDESVATVSSSGLVVGVTAGWVDITATSSDGKSTTAPILFASC